MNKTVFAKDKWAVDEEGARLKELIRLGGFIPCPDHRLLRMQKLNWCNIIAGK